MKFFLLVLKCLKFDCFMLQSQKMKCLVFWGSPIQTLFYTGDQSYWEKQKIQER